MKIEPGYYNIRVAYLAKDGQSHVSYRSGIAIFNDEEKKEWTEYLKGQIEYDALEGSIAIDYKYTGEPLCLTAL